LLSVGGERRNRQALGFGLGDNDDDVGTVAEAGGSWFTSLWNPAVVVCIIGDDVVMSKVQKLLIYGFVLVVEFVLLVVIFGWGLAALGLTGVGAGVGIWFGARTGNQEARKIAKYRDEWIARRRGMGVAAPRSTSDASQSDGHPTATEEPESPRTSSGWLLCIKSVDQSCRSVGRNDQPDLPAYGP
jgi:hypothetical protein